MERQQTAEFNDTTDMMNDTQTQSDAEEDAEPVSKPTGYKCGCDVCVSLGKLRSAYFLEPAPAPRYPQRLGGAGTLA